MISRKPENQKQCKSGKSPIIIFDVDYCILVFFLGKSPPQWLNGVTLSIRMNNLKYTTVGVETLVPAPPSCGKGLPCAENVMNGWMTTSYHTKADEQTIKLPFHYILNE